MAGQTVTIRLGLGLDSEALSVLHSITNAVQQAQNKVSNEAEKLRKQAEADERRHQKRMARLAQDEADWELKIFRTWLQTRKRLREQEAQARKEAETKARTDAWAAAMEDLSDFRRVLLARQKARRSAAKAEAKALQETASEAQRLADEELAHFRATLRARMMARKKEQSEAARLASEELSVLRQTWKQRRKLERDHEHEQRRKRSADQRQAETDAYADLKIQKRVWAERASMRSRGAHEARQQERREQSEQQKAAERRAASRQRIVSAVGNVVGRGYQTGRDLLEAMGVDMSLTGAVARSDKGIRMATALSNAAVVASDPKNARRVGPEKLLSETRELGVQYGFSTEQGLEALTRFTEKTGDLAAVRPILGKLAELAAATGSNIEHVADAAAEASLQLGDMEDKSEGIADVLRNAAAQAKVGTVEFKNFASHYGKIVATSRFFRNERADQMTTREALKGNQATLVALAQFAKAGGAGSVREQIIGVSTFMTQFQKGKRRDAMRNILGESIEKDGQLRDPFELLKLMMRKTGGKLDLLHPMIQDAQAKRVTIAMAQKYTEAREAIRKEHPEFTKEQLDDAAILQLEEAFNKLRKATLSQMEVETSLAAIRGRGLNSANEFNIRFEQFGDTMRNSLLPLLPAMTAGVVALAQAAKNFIGATGVGLTTTVRESVSAGSAVDETVGVVHKVLSAASQENPVEISSAQVETVAREKEAADKALAEAKAEQDANFTPGLSAVDKRQIGESDDALTRMLVDLAHLAPDFLGLKPPVKPSDITPGARQASEANIAIRQIDAERLAKALDNLTSGIQTGRLRVKLDPAPTSATANGQPPGATTPGTAEIE